MSDNGVLPTRLLATLIEASEIALLRAFLESAARLRPDFPFESAVIGGGIAVFMGNASPLSQATRLALEGPIEASDLEALTRFYHERGAPARVWVNPLADKSLERHLAGARYVPVGRNNVLATDLAHCNAQRDRRIVEEWDLSTWGRASARGFHERHDGEDEGAFLGTAIASGAGVIALSLREEGAIVATGAMAIHGELGSLFAGSTLEDRRKSGYHRALIVDRLARAREAGARYARTSAPLAGTSEANFRRCGFEVLYTRTLWELPIPTRTP